LCHHVYFFYAGPEADIVKKTSHIRIVLLLFQGLLLQGQTQLNSARNKESNQSQKVVYKGGERGWVMSG
jgi:hypothetical protein